MKIKYQGFKGHDGEYDLGRACLIQGPNDVGKSSLVGAIHFALAGKMAGLRMGKGDTQDPGRLLKAIDDGGWAEVELDGTTVKRTLQATAKKARVLTVCDGLDGKEGEAAAARLQGDLLFADFRRLVAAGDKERSDILTSYLPQPDDAEKRRWAMGQAMKHMEAALKSPKRGKKKQPGHAGRLDKEAAAKLNASLLSLADANDCRPQMDEALAHVFSLRDATPEDMVEAMKKAANAADQARKDAGKVAAEAAKSTHDADLSATIPELEAEVNELRALSKSAGDAEKARTAWERDTARLAERREDLADETTAIGRQAEGVAEARAKLAQLSDDAEEAQRGRPQAPDAAGLKDLEARVKPLREERARLRPVAARVAQSEVALAKAVEEEQAVSMTKPTPPADEVVALRRARDELATGIATTKAEGRALRERMEGAEAGNCPLTLAVCPDDLAKFVKEARIELRDMAKKIVADAAEVAGIEEKIAAQEAARDDHYRAQSEWARRHDVAKSGLKVARDAAKEAQRAAERLDKVVTELAPMERELALLGTARDGHEAAFSTWVAKVAKADAAVAGQREALSNAAAAARRAAELGADLKRVAKELEEKLAAEPPDADADASLLGEVEDRLRAAHAARGRLDVLGRLDVDALTIAATLRKASALGAAEGLTACVQAATAPVCGKITEALGRMGVEGEFYVDLENRTFGLIEGGKEIDVEVLGGGKAVLFAAAMLSALPPREGPRVLTLEGAELHPDWMGRLLEGLDWRAFDAVVVATCHPPATVPEGWTTIKMGCDR